MRHTPSFLMTEVDEVRRLVRGNPWATIVSSTAEGLVASHYPFLLEEQPDGSDDIVLVSHVGRPDEVAHELGQHEVLVVVQGPHGYVSPAWYPPEQFIPTWNHTTAHLWGTPEILSDEENFRVLGDLVDHFEAAMPSPVSLDVDADAARRIARGTVGIRIRVTRFDARAKLSQNKAPEVVDRIIAGLRTDGPYASPALADEMARVQGTTTTGLEA
ncbi:FMN-binding negative transcriptional regulator [Curtobacterium sp. MCJR17_055]|uniref:FMN-binding negative transcriptional regulator n=1 Tax=unclassified Curtobacterium TaxID=257496 RepID=UPI000D8420B7|nr:MULTISPECIES: FMN-binding negative transcriptional regulator [unclassified Curtobacterium]PYY34532.1 FMN-binding negative transcriptional regulator [Curtobacterium sp. MCBD17_029]PYY57652.1 FMN-binding negative transcriptional regulator [Curtobacterium sp. MCPF17_015]PYY58310.1 FMN-binding negative transcriptional regulator [Curtobacterium sp. MCJR17_055]